MARSIHQAATLALLTAGAFACHDVAGVKARTLEEPALPDAGAVDAASPPAAEVDASSTAVAPGTIETFAPGVWAKDIAVDADRIFVADVKREDIDSRIVRYGKTPGAEPVTFVSRDQIEQASLRDMVATADNVYWMSWGGNVLRRDKAGAGRIDDLAIGGKPSAIRAASSDRIAVSVSEPSPDGGPSYYFVEIWSEATRTATRIPDAKVTAVILDGEDVYVFTYDGRYGRWRIGDGAVTTLGTYRGEGPQRPVKVGDELYFMNAVELTSSLPRTLYRVPITGGTPSKVWTDDTESSLSFDDGYLYLLSNGRYVQDVLRGGKILRCEPARCADTMTVVVRDVVALSGIGFDDDWVYWTEGGTGPTDPGRVRRFKK